MRDRLQEQLERLKAFLFRRKLDEDFQRELASHIEMAVEENLRRGLPADEARRQALVRLGGVEQAREQQRDARGLVWLNDLGRDLRSSCRSLGRNRVFTLVAVLILALGIGANVAVFSVVNTILLRPLPLVHPKQLVWIAPQIGAACGFSCETYSADAFDEFRARNHSFQDVTGYYAFSPEDNGRLTSRGNPVPVPVTGIGVVANFFQVLGVRPKLGRLFTADEARKNSPPVVLLSNAFWKRQYAADPSIVGQTIDLNGQPTTVVGVLPARFDFGAMFSPGEKVDLFGPVSLDEIRNEGNTLTMIGRLKPGVSVSQGQADAALVAPRLDFNAKYPSFKALYKANLYPLKQYVTGRLRRPLLMLWIAVGAILLLVCVNLSNLLLARAATRSKEFALRSALGAGRMRLVRQLLTESLVLSSAGAVLGLGLAAAITTLLAHQGSIALPLLGEVRVDGAALAWTLLVTVTVAIVFGVVPSLKISAGNLQETLKDAGHGMAEGRRNERVRAGLVVAEMALACILLAGAGLLLRSFLQVLDVNLGFQPARAAAIKVDYDDGNNPARRAAIFQQMLSRVQAVPGVEAAGLVDFLPLGRNRSWGALTVKGKVYQPGEAPSPLVYVVTPGFFRAMGMKLVGGRDFRWDDAPSGQSVIVINRAVARALWPNGDAVGQMVHTSSGSDAKVIGVVAGVHETSVEGAAGWQAYYPATQDAPEGAELVFRTRLPPAAVGPSVLGALRELNPSQTAAKIVPLRQIVDQAVSPRRFFVLLVASFALFALLLASLGIYGVVSYSVTRRTQEIGVRMALGASPGGVRLMVLRETLRLALGGIVLGVVAAFVGARLITSLLFGIAPADPLTFAATVVVLSTVALVAGYLPARRASRIEPMTALRAN